MKIWVLSKNKCYNTDLMDSNVSLFYKREDALAIFNAAKEQFIKEQLELLNITNIEDSNAVIIDLDEYYSYVSEGGDLEFRLTVMEKEVL